MKWKGLTRTYNDDYKLKKTLSPHDGMVCLISSLQWLYSPAEWCKIQDGVCILSYKHEILHKGAFGCALSYLSKRQTFFSRYSRQIQDGRHQPF